ncbi:hypothetical protein P5673_002065 [Acropora cervicornis]|uniref:RWD domain-containing protein n=1 Tax=Acropora cervicornis TaxID=6130 RepID=A0AAD9VGH7_ACRCE|nr:hypothetical protein P5673_002065 [Acropora cervicornis]
MALFSDPETQRTIDKELEIVKKTLNEKVEGSELISCHPLAVNVRITRTKFKSVIVLLQFPEKYPADAIVVELKSKTIPPSLLVKMTRLCDQEAKTLAGKSQVIPMLSFVRRFIDENPLIACYDELQYVKSRLLTDADQLKVKQKAGILNIRANQDQYFLDVKLTVPDDYYTAAVRVEMKESNFPENLVKVFVGRAVDMARQCVEAPLRRTPKDPPFEPKPSLKIVCDFLISECVRPCPRELCPVCKQKALPDNPKDIVSDSSDQKFVERVYCNHLFHYGCLDKYMKTPPFTGGKKCPSCKQRIYHERWKITPKLAEERWAHHEAKKRELSEVVDFLGDCL